VRRGQIPTQRVHRGDADPAQEAEAQPNQKLQQLPGETITCEYKASLVVLFLKCAGTELRGLQ